jgi:polysaccharide chain length determinant protein (PEP-CTERM system associated)
MMDSFDISNYLDIALKRKYWIIIPFLLSLLGGLAYFLNAPKIYGAHTVILVQPQKVPENFVRTIISTSVQDRLRTITQQVTSRTNLEKIAKEYQLFAGRDIQLSLDPLIAELKKEIRIDVSESVQGGASTFVIAFRGKSPKKVMQVTNALASNFISENLRIRESQALGTSNFLADELNSVERRLLEKEDELKLYRERYMGGLPEQLQTNLAILGRLQVQVDQYNDSLRDAENRKIIIQNQIAEMSKASSSLNASISQQNPNPQDLVSLRNLLASLETRYTQNHPDVIRLRNQIAKLEAEQSEAPTPDSVPDQASGMSRAVWDLKQQLQDIEYAMRTLKSDIKKTESQINAYQKKIEDTPKREQELLTLKRDYENLKGLYSSLLNRKLEAEIAVSMEKKQQGEQFMVIDPARVPWKPVEPDVTRIILMSLVIGLGLGLGLVYLIEVMDNSFKNPEDVEKDIQLPVLVSLPFHYTDRERRIQKVNEFLKAASVALGFTFCTVGIVFATKGIDTTVNFAKTFLTNLGVL